MLLSISIIIIIIIIMATNSGPLKTETDKMGRSPPITTHKHELLTILYKVLLFPGTSAMINGWLSFGVTHMECRLAHIKKNKFFLYIVWFQKISIPHHGGKFTKNPLTSPDFPFKKKEQ